MRRILASAGGSYTVLGKNLGDDQFVFSVARGL
jgi:hypothetical protein